MQLSLSILEQPALDIQAWESLDDEQRNLVIELLARMIAKAVIAKRDAEQNHE